jgi:hypothetical protein
VVPVINDPKRVLRRAASPDLPKKERKRVLRKRRDPKRSVVNATLQFD